MPRYPSVAYGRHEIRGTTIVVELRQSGIELSRTLLFTLTVCLRKPESSLVLDRKKFATPLKDGVAPTRAVVVLSVPTALDGKRGSESGHKIEATTTLDGPEIIL